MRISNVGLDEIPDECKVSVAAAGGGEDLAVL